MDGVLIDSYRGIKIFYTKTLPSLKGFDRVDGEVLYWYEMYSEGLGVLRSEWWPRRLTWLSRRELEELMEKYWEVRIKYSRPIPGAKYVLRRLRSMGVFLGSVSYRDDIPGLKIERMKMFDLDKYFDDILIVGDHVKTRSEGLRVLRDKHMLGKVYYVDDKPGNLWRIKRVEPWVLTINYRFQYKPSYPWDIPYTGDYMIYSLPEIIGIIKKDLS